MIQPNEQKIKLADVPEWLKSHFGNGETRGKSTVFSWVSPGKKGVQLETLAVGATRYTTVEALYRFFANLASADQIARSQGTRAGMRRASLRRRLQNDQRAHALGI